MEDLVIRPSTKIAIAWDVVATLAIVGGGLTGYAWSPNYWWIGALPGLGLLLAGIILFVRLQLTKMIISSDRLRHESGFISKSTHTIDLAKVQDVRVDQSVTQRLLGMGLISVETSGGSSAIAMDNVDNPHKIADMILERSRQSPRHTP